MSSTCSAQPCLPLSLTPSTPNWRAFFMLPFPFPPSAQHSSQTEVCLSFPPSPFSRRAGLGREDKKWEGGLVCEGRLLRGWDCCPRGESTWVCAACSLPPAREGGYWNLCPVPTGTAPRLPRLGEIFRITDASLTGSLLWDGIQSSESTPGGVQGHQRRSWPFVYVAHAMQWLVCTALYISCWYILLKIVNSWIYATTEQTIKGIESWNIE